MIEITDDLDQLKNTVEEFSNEIDRVYRRQYLFEACMAVCELCKDVQNNPYTDVKRNSHYFTNQNSVTHITPCKAAKIHAIMES